MKTLMLNWYGSMSKAKRIALILSWVFLAIFLTVVIAKVNFYPATAAMMILCIVTYLLTTLALFGRK